MHSVKHLNPRQGITTLTVPVARGFARTALMCETPKSPPGDYNRTVSTRSAERSNHACETPKSPPGDYNLTNTHTHQYDKQTCGVKHLNPRQGITTPF